MLKQLLAVAGDEAANFMLFTVCKLLLVVSGARLTAVVLPRAHLLIEMQEGLKALAKVAFLVDVF